jgi:hypothetical protein
MDRNRGYDRELTHASTGATVDCTVVCDALTARGLQC